MRGKSITNVRHSLKNITEHMREGDQISFVLYGRDVVTHLEPIAITKRNKAVIKKKINAIRVEGSTNMDKGLARGYDIAHATPVSYTHLTLPTICSV